MWPLPHKDRSEVGLPLALGHLPGGQLPKDSQDPPGALPWEKEMPIMSFSRKCLEKKKLLPRSKAGRAKAATSQRGPQGPERGSGLFGKTRAVSGRAGKEAGSPGSAQGLIHFHLALLVSLCSELQVTTALSKQTESAPLSLLGGLTASGSSGPATGSGIRATGGGWLSSQVTTGHARRRGSPAEHCLVWAALWASRL